MKLFLSPHNDDECLFGAFTLLRESLLVVVVFDGYVQASRGLAVTAEERRRESAAACEILGCEVCFLGFRDDDPHVSPLAVGNRIRDLVPAVECVYAPGFESGGHPQHNLVAAASNQFRIARRYLTYTPAGKSTSENEVPILESEWIARKHSALACYTSQHSLDPRMGCYPHFLGCQREYYR